MWENPFYVDTIRDFRDLRYKYKTLAGQHAWLKWESNNENEKHSALAVYYESL